MIKENGFPEPVLTGRSHHHEISKIFKWLTNEARRHIGETDRLLSSKTIEAIFKRSPAWVWQKFQKDKARKAKAIYLRSRPYWLESEIYADHELRKYLDIVEGAI